MTTSNNATISNSHVVYHQAKFRWTENLTCRFIQLRKEHGKMFTGRKYSAQAGWEYILRQMREEFPTIMADVHYRVLKKKWSNLLQQYKELKNPVHGDKNKADDISWPFYAAIDEVLGNIALPGSAASAAAAARRHRTNSSNNEQEDNDDDDEEDLNPQEFLCVSVAPDNDDQLDLNVYEDDRLPELQSISSRRAGPVFDVDRIPRTTRRSTTTTTTSTTTISRKRNTVGEDSSNLLSRLPRATELTIRPIRRNTTTTICSSSTTSTSEVPTLSNANGSSCDIIKDFVDTKDKNEDYDEEEDERPSKCCKTENCQDYYTRENRESRLEKKIVEFFEYTKKRDEENRNILMRMLEAVEDIRKAVS